MNNDQRDLLLIWIRHWSACQYYRSTYRMVTGYRRADVVYWPKSWSVMLIRCPSEPLTTWTQLAGDEPRPADLTGPSRNPDGRGKASFPDPWQLCPSDVSTAAAQSQANHRCRTCTGVYRCKRYYTVTATGRNCVSR